MCPLFVLCIILSNEFNSWILFEYLMTPIRLIGITSINTNLFYYQIARIRKIEMYMIDFKIRWMFQSQNNEKAKSVKIKK